MNNFNIKYYHTAFFISMILVSNVWSDTIGSLSAQTKSDKKDIYLSLNENPFRVSDKVRGSIISEIENINRYAGEDGIDFVKFVAAHEGVDPDQIIAGEILDLLGVYLVLKNGVGSEIIHTVPGYPVFANAAASVGGKVVEVPLNDNLENDLASIEEQVTDKTTAIFLVNPHNPSGTAIESDALHDFINRVSKKALIVIDEAYLEYTDNFEERTALKNLKNGDNVIVFRTLAKAYALGGLTMGYAVAPLDLARYLKSKGLGATHALNRLSIVAAKASLADQEKVKRESNIVKEEREKWHNLLDEIGLKHSNSQANFIFIDTQRPSHEVKQFLENNGVKIGPLYDAYPTWIRISIGTPEENIQAQTILRKSLVNIN